MTKATLKEILNPIYIVIDILLFPFTLLASILLFLIRRAGVRRMKISKWVFKKIGVFPIVDHYYEPLFKETHLKRSLDIERKLPGIKWNDNAQISLLDEFNFQEELESIPYYRSDDPLQFYYANPSLGPADAEYLYCMIRHFKPSRIIEIGSGYSTLMAKKAIEKNLENDPSRNCKQICIEPYEMPWLEKTNVQVIRKLVEDVDISLFSTLQENDILFIDSSHIIRPQGDVLFEILEILPELNPGVIIHIHDIFSPRDYTKEHVVNNVLFWNEQYLLEAFLSCNNDFVIIGALNYLKTNFPNRLYSKLPIFKNNPSHIPGSFWIQKRIN